ncbi:hypothetical protein FZEAL_8163 [Fusarium zealandicum]|uniref:Luciferase domain-containing protein n=1 Tax=Fusarium zealandicum TaxID=1053134 RepID=A0A8H4UF56_9HYPO|nr:hypothetical protein FZEAL_8163 [Fusarium zealandicum]
MIGTPWYCKVGKQVMTWGDRMFGCFEPESFSPAGRASSWKGCWCVDDEKSCWVVTLYTDPSDPSPRIGGGRSSPAYTGALYQQTMEANKEKENSEEETNSVVNGGGTVSSRDKEDGGGGGGLSEHNIAIIGVASTLMGCLLTGIWRSVYLEEAAAAIMASALIQSLGQFLSGNRRIVGTILAAAVIGIPVIRLAVLDYRGYIDLGPGGPPHNIAGWLFQLVLRPITKEPFHTSCYNAKAIAQAGPNGNAAFLSQDDVPSRSSPRPLVGSWTAPSRQLTDQADEKINARYQKFLVSLASASPSQLKMATSKAERHGPALCVASENPSHPVARWTEGEIAHMHATDGSMHLNLTPKDARLVLERGWGQRHPLSGRALYIGLVMIYAPRGEEELAVVQSITRASVKFMLGEEA